MESNVQHVVKQVSKFDGKHADDILEWSSKLRVSLSLYSKPIFEIVQRPQRPSGLDNNQVAAREGWDNANHNVFSILYFTTSGPVFSVVRRFEGKTREDGVGHGHDVWAALREKFDGFSRVALRAAYRKWERVKMRSDKDPDDFLYKRGPVPRPPKFRHTQGGPLGPMVRGHNLTVPSTRVRQDPPDAL